jgi:hypothetical protein
MQNLKQMWAIQHVSSGAWDQGDAKLTLYPFDYEANYDCQNNAFRPVKVWVTDFKPQVEKGEVVKACPRCGNLEIEAARNGAMQCRVGHLFNEPTYYRRIPAPVRGEVVKP